MKTLVRFILNPPPSHPPPPPVLNFLWMSLLCAEHLRLTIYQWKVSVVAFVISILSFLKHLFSSPPLSSRTPPHFLPSCSVLRSCYPTLALHFLLLLIRLLLSCSLSPALARTLDTRAYIFVRLRACVRACASVDVYHQ